MKVIRLAGQTDFAGWRTAARELVLARVPPESVEWAVDDTHSLFEETEPPDLPLAKDAPFSVPAAFVRLAGDVIFHSDRQRFGLLYRLLWRLRQEPRLLADATDEDVTRARNMKKAVDRDIHKMHAYVRFRESQQAEGPVYISWFEPSHHTLGPAAPFFVRRFAAMRWSILTPRASAYWDGEALDFGPGASRADAPDGDALEELWRSYYRSIFNPARLKVRAMQGHMPKKYWANLPEAGLIPGLIGEAVSRTGVMIEAGATPPRRRVVTYQPQPLRAPVDSLDTLRSDAAQCRACPLWQRATQTVFGEGPREAHVMFVGEQPGDQEDLSGRTFVGPAGRLFDRALAAAGLNRAAVYVTNAVKHFKFEPRGKRRLHKTPAQQEVEACQRWLEQELALVKPKLVVALGGTALRALTGVSASVQSMRGRVRPWKEGADLLVTVHPPFLLRVPGEMQAREFERFVADLDLAARHRVESS